MNGNANSGTAGVYTIAGSQNGGSQTADISGAYAGAGANSNTGNVAKGYKSYSQPGGGGSYLGEVIMSNVGGNPITYPNPGYGVFNGNAYYFRQGQAVQFDPHRRV